MVSPREAATPFRTRPQIAACGCGDKGQKVGEAVVELAAWQFWLQIIFIAFAAGGGWVQLRNIKSWVQDIAHSQKEDHDLLIALGRDVSNCGIIETTVRHELERRIKALERRVFNGRPPREDNDG